MTWSRLPRLPRSLPLQSLICTTFPEVSTRCWVHPLSSYPINNSTQTSSSVKPGPTGTPSSCAPYWLENIKHQGLASFNPNATSYEIFRNVKDFGAKGDGLTDDTAAIQRAITEGNRCTPGYCESTTTTPAVVYFPGGTYVISASIIDYYYTQVNHTTHLRNGSLLKVTDHRQP
jgi:hypothetical protein